MAPVEHAAHPLQLATEVGDVAGNQFGRMQADLDRVVLAVNPERVIADRLENVVPLQPLEPAIHVAAGKGEHVPHMQPLGGGIGEHHQVVERPGSAVEIRQIGATLSPAGAPLGFNLFGPVVVGDGVGHRGGNLRGAGGEKGVGGRRGARRGSPAPAARRPLLLTCPRLAAAPNFTPSLPLLAEPPTWPTHAARLCNGCTSPPGPCWSASASCWS